MHAGEALWQVWGLVGFLNKAGQPALALHIQEAASVLGEHISVTAPSDEQLLQLSSALENLTGSSGMGYATERQQSTTTKGRSENSDPDLLEAANKLVDEMVGSEQFGWAGLVTSVELQLKEKQFITPKQCLALKNIAAGRKYREDEQFGNFWEWFADENPEAAKLVEARAGAV